MQERELIDEIDEGGEGDGDSPRVQRVDQESLSLPCLPHTP